VRTQTVVESRGLAVRIELRISKGLKILNPFVLSPGKGEVDGFQGAHSNRDELLEARDTTRNDIAEAAPGLGGNANATTSSVTSSGDQGLVHSRVHIHAIEDEGRVYNCNSESLSSVPVQSADGESSFGIIESEGDT
jgi:hypothetical protein